ncbi:MAG TPA: rRNA maturation RNase YbeY [Puia sp.]|nr:rRNA maturation RNase YbeY [Puia sp.]
MDKPGRLKVYLHKTKGLDLPQRIRLGRFIESIFRREHIKLAELHYNFCSDNEIRSLNAKWLGHDYITDILTFNYATPMLPVSGDIFLGTAEIKRNAQRYNSTIRQETLRVMFHGALHLSGYDDKTDPQKQAMRRQEDHYLRLYATASK